MIHGSSIINVKSYRKVIDIGIKTWKARGYSLRLCIKLKPFGAYTFSKKGGGQNWLPQHAFYVTKSPFD